MDFEQPEIEVEEQEIESFRDELRKMQKEKNCDPHLRAMNPDEFGIEELELWKKFKEDILAEDDLNEYRKTVLSPHFEGKGFKDILADSRSNFTAFILNKMLSRQAERKLKEDEKAA